MGKLLKGTSFIVILMSILFSTVFYSCDNDDDNDDDIKEPTGTIVFKFDHKVGNEAIEIDTMKYFNAAGNKYEVSEVQYFISNVILHKKDGGTKVIGDWSFYHYVDTDIPTSLIWKVVDGIPVGEYSSISFTFGIDSTKNDPYMFVNPPEVNMFWPFILGGDHGGYHYLKLNGFWIDTNTVRRPFNFHVGVGQKYKYDTIDIKNIEYYIQNTFTVDLANSSFTINENDTIEAQLVMNIENWFQTPNSYDHNEWGGDIMQKQAAMQLAKENGLDVFSIGYIK